MAYIINKYDGEAILTLQDGTVDATTSVKLVGRNYVGYGEIQNENFLFLLENFANEAPPARPLAGQTWFDTVNNALSVYDGSRWTSLGTATISLEEPSDPGDGLLWFKEPYNTLYVWKGDEWILIGPDVVEGYGQTREESTTLIDTVGVEHPVIKFWVNDEVTGIASADTFLLGDENPIDGLSEIVAGLNVPGDMWIQGDSLGNASSATKLENIRTINGVGFNGTEDITITAATTGNLIAGDYIIGSDFTGDDAVEWAVDGTAANIAGKVVVRDFNGNFTASKITADQFIGQVNTPVGTSNFDVIRANEIIGQNFAGTASAASKLLPGKYINNVKFDGTEDITVPANAETLTGSYINSTVLSSALERVGTLESLSVRDAGITVGSASEFQLYVDGAEVKLNIANGSQLSFVNATTAESMGGNLSPAILCKTVTDLGLPGYKFDNVHANVFHGEATSARFADLAEYYTSDKDYEPGTVVVFGGEAEVTESTMFADSKVAGVVTTNPGFTMNTECVGTRVCIALQGRVPCKVVGPVSKGDLITTSHIAGYATVAIAPSVGTVIGKAIEDKITEGTDYIEVAIGKM